MTTLHEILDHYRTIAKSEREKGTYFELVIKDYLTVEPAYATLYSKVWMYADWANETAGKSHYPLAIFLRVATVSLETNRIVESLPKMEI